VLIGQTLAFTLGGEIIAIDAGTGKERWRKPTGGRARLYTWNLNGQPYFLTSADTRGSAEKQLVSVFRPDDGQMVWQSPAPFDFQFTGYMLPVLSGDLLFGLRFDMSDKTGSKSAVVAARLTPKGIEPVWEVNPLMERFDAYQLAERDGFLYVTGYKEVWVIETKTGKVVAKVPGAGGMATPVIFTAEDRVFIYPEGRHGGSQVIMLIAAGADTRVLSPDIATGGNMAGWNGTWTVPHPSTTAYAVGQLIHPIVDGRLFVRGADGIYCYDLRAASKP
jgi:outer membrane protein assembly factor BamB